MSKPDKNNTNLTNQNTEESAPSFNMIDVLRKIIFISLMVIVFYPPYFKGLFFESEVLPSEILVFLVSILFWVYKYLNKDKKFLKTPIEYSAFGFIFVYLISIVAAVSARSAVVEWLKYCMFFSVFFMLSDIIKTQKEKMTVLWVIMASAVGISLLGIDGMAGSGFSNIVNLFFPKDQPLIASLFVSGRIYSMLQYPGALSAYLTAVLFISVIPSITGSKQWIRILSSGLGSIMVFTLIFTFSRGAFVLIPAALILFLIILPKGTRIKCAFYILSISLPTGLVSLNLTRVYLSQLPGHAAAVWMHALIAAALSIGCMILTQYFIGKLEKINWKVYASTVLIVLIGLAVGISIVLNSALPLDLSSTEMQTVRRSIALKPNMNYKLLLNVEAQSSDKDVDLYTIKLFNKNEKNILFDSESQITEFKGKGTKGAEKKEIQFKVPKDSKLIELEFSNLSKGTEVRFDNARVVSPDGKEIMKVILNYKYMSYEVADRFQNLLSSKSAVERITFYKDSMKSIKDHLLLGAGGGAWQLIYLKHQSYNYYTTQTHNYFLQLAIESGLVGILIMLALLLSIALILVKLIKNKNTENQYGIFKASVITAAVFMLMHSAIDFDFSLSAVFMLFWELLAIMNARHESDDNEQMTGVFSDANYKQLYIKPIIVVIVASVITILPIMLTLAGFYSNASSKALNDGKADKALENIKSAALLDPLNPQIRYDYADALLKNGNYNEAVKNIGEAEYLGRNNIEIVAKAATFYSATIDIDKTNIEKSLRAADEAIKIGPFVSGAWGQKTNALYQAALYYFGNRESQKGLSYVDKIINISEEVKQVNKSNMNPIILSPASYEKIERMVYLKGLKEQIPISKLMFYNIPGLDVNLDNIPDQWSPDRDITISSIGDTMTAENKNPGKVEFIKSRDIFIKPDKTYRIELEMNTEANSIPYSITNTSLTNGHLKKINNVFYGEIVTPKGDEMMTVALNIGVTGKYEIKSLRMIEE